MKFLPPSTQVIDAPSLVLVLDACLPTCLPALSAHFAIAPPCNRGDVEHSQWLTDDVNEYALGASQGLGGRSEAASAQGLLVGEQEQEQARDDSERWFMEVSASIWAELNELKDTYKNILIWLKPGTPKVFIRKVGLEVAV